MIVHQRRSVAELHALDPFDAQITSAQVWWCDPLDAAVALGSRQPLDVVDADACAEAGLGVVRRRSGGGAVLVDGGLAWADIVLLHGAAPDDVRGAMVWAGERWQEAIAATAADIAGSIEVHRGGMVESAWSRLVCFAGLGPGEITLDGHKLVGLSQRRTRGGIRIQGMVYLAPPTVDLRRLFAVPTPDEPLPEPAVLGSIDARALAAALKAAIAPD